jgi:glycosyltransferase involved in cell wall biosynthesis
LREQLAFLLDHPDLVGGEFSKARDYVRRERNWETTADRFEELYWDLLLARRRLRMITATT